MKCLIFRLLCFVIFFTPPINLIARETYWASGKVFDAESGRRLYGSKVEVIDSVSGNLLSKGDDIAPEKQYLLLYGDRDFHFGINIGDETKSYITIFKVECANYKPVSFSLKFPEQFNHEGQTELDTIWMVPADCEVDAKTLIRLREVTVTATKIKMVMRGDTIIYNADAFNLSSGSMLDALISQLPGVELSNSGQIKVNGEFVSSLLVDGKEFFNGNPNVALRNLPSYTVKTVKVHRYDATEGEDVSVKKNELPLVMDVRLKPQYQQGFLGNIGIGYGLPGNRYMGRVFGLEYAKNARVAAFAQTNNINSEASGPGLGGTDWDNNSSTSGQKDVIKSGINFNVDSSKRFNISGNAVYTRTDTKDIRTMAASLFQPNANNVYSRSASNRNDLSHNLNSKISWNLKKISYFLSPNASLMVNMGYDYHRDNDMSMTRSADFNREPSGSAIDSIFGIHGAEYGSRHTAIFRNKTDKDGETENHSAYTDLKISQIVKATKLNDGTKIYNHLSLAWNYDHTQAQNSLSREIIYTNDAQNIAQNQSDCKFDRYWIISPVWRTVFNIRNYMEHDKEITLVISPAYSYESSVGNRKVYELDNPFQSLADALLDATNSYYSNLDSHIGGLKAQFTYGWTGQNRIDINLEGRAIHSHLLYQRDNLHADISQLRWDWHTDLSSEYQLEYGHNIRLNAGLRRSLPSLVSLLETTDNSNPLNVYLGNPNLKPSTILDINIRYENNKQQTGRQFTATFGHNYYWNRRSQFRHFDRESGVNTYMPVNVSGAYTLNARADVTKRLDRDNRWYLSASTAASYENIPDWMSVGDRNMVLSKINNVLLSQNLRFNWTVAEGYSLSFGENVGWRNATSTLEGFSTINILDLVAKLASQMKLPWKLEFATDINFYRRFGYGESTLNTANWVWNASIQRPLIKGALTVKLEGFDILGQISNVTYSINSLGSTETWTNALHRYVMLSLSYRFNVMPRGAKTDLL